MKKFIFLLSLVVILPSMTLLARGGGGHGGGHGGDRGGDRGGEERGRGEQGAYGEHGAYGERGAAGAYGERGAAGAYGERGAVGGYGAAGYGGAAAVGAGAHQNRGDSYYNARQNVDPNLYYGYGGGYYNGGYGLIYDPNYQSDPGQVDDTDALYQSYLRSNPPMQ